MTTNTTSHFVIERLERPLRAEGGDPLRWEVRSGHACGIQRFATYHEARLWMTIAKACPDPDEVTRVYLSKFAERQQPHPVVRVNPQPCLKRKPRPAKAVKKFRPARPARPVKQAKAEAASPPFHPFHPFAPDSSQPHPSLTGFPKPCRKWNSSYGQKP
jgi:hypothetical protein